jgi:hypothetical protein
MAATKAVCGEVCGGYLASSASIRAVDAFLAWAELLALGWRTFDFIPSAPRNSAQLLKGRRPGLPQGTRGQLHARGSVRHGSASSCTVEPSSARGNSRDSYVTLRSTPS